MKRLLAVVAGCVLALCLAGVAESQCQNGTCQVPQTQWRASAQRTNSIPFGGRLIPMRPIIRPVQPAQPRAQINVQPATPQVIIQADPSAASAADSLARIAQAVEPPPLLEQLVEEPKQMTPLLAGLVILVAGVVGFFIFFKTQEN